MKASKFLFVAVAALLGFSTSSFAQGHWAQHHPRRKEVNNRLENQNDRIDKEKKEGDLTKSQAKTLHADDHKIRKEERLAASQNHGHISKAEKKALNQQENAVSKKVGN